MMKVKANPKNIASILTQRKRIQFKAQDVRNVISNGVYSGQKSLFIPPTHFSRPANSSLKIA